MQDIVYEAGMRALCHMAETNGGRLPATVDEMRDLPAAYGIGLEASTSYKLVIGADDDVFITYRSDDPPRTQMAGILHEIAEYICIGDFPTLFDGLPGAEYHRTGNGAPRDFRHQVALFAERAYTEWLKRL
jgi:hypothetical protein